MPAAPGEGATAGPARAAGSPTGRTSAPATTVAASRVDHVRRDERADGTRIKEPPSELSAPACDRTRRRTVPSHRTPSSGGRTLERQLAVDHHGEPVGDFLGQVGRDRFDHDADERLGA